MHDVPLQRAAGCKNKDSKIIAEILLFYKKKMVENCRR